MKFHHTLLAAAVGSILGGCGGTPPPLQGPDLDFRPEVGPPAYPTTAASGDAPRVLIDEAHFNFHTAGGRYAPFAEVLRRDGYSVDAFSTSFTAQSLEDADILVISNPVAEQNRQEWVLPTPSAFTDEEIEAVASWVRTGGSLLLIADHMPFPGATEDLARAFGVLFNNGYTRDIDTGSGTVAFSRADHSLREHPIANGRSSEERVKAVTAFTGQGFRPRPGVELEEVLVLGENIVLLMPTEAGELTDTTPRVPAEGWLLGAVLRHGEGRVALFGEAAMFSAQLSGEDSDPMGMNHPDAVENAQFLLNVMHWLSGLLP